MAKGKNCPNCGAVIVGDRCEYCGTSFYDFTNVEVCGEPCFLTIKVHGKPITVKARCLQCDVTVETIDCCYLDDYCISQHRIISNPSSTIKLEFVTV